MPGLKGVDHISLTVADLDAASHFYCDLLGATPAYELGPFDSRELPPTADGRDWTAAHLDVPDARLRFRAIMFGSLRVELMHYERPTNTTAAPPRGCDAGGHHVGFQVEDIEAAAAYLIGRGVQVLDGPIAVPAEAPSGAMLNRYFSDPWGNQLELTEVPK